MRVIIILIILIGNISVCNAWRIEVKNNHTSEIKNYHPPRKDLFNIPLPDLEKANISCKLEVEYKAYKKKFRDVICFSGLTLFTVTVMESTTSHFSIVNTTDVTKNKMHGYTITVY